MTKHIDLDALQVLAACPFCGSDDIIHAPDYPVTCNQCEATALNVAAWNRRAATSKSAEAWQPKFEVMAYDQEQLAIKFCNEIAGKAGGKGSPPDPVRLLEMAEALYLAERNDPVVGIAAPECSKSAEADANRWRLACAYEDNAGTLYCAVMNNAGDTEAINAEFDAEAISTSRATEGGKEGGE